MRLPSDVQCSLVELARCDRALDSIQGAVARAIGSGLEQELAAKLMRAEAELRVAVKSHVLAMAGRAP